MRKYNEDGKIYYGEWQLGDTVKQLLEGPIGKGAIDYPNGDRFEGFFHLSYACINGPAYAARGKYLFANGDVVDDCWIDGNDQLMGRSPALPALCPRSATRARACIPRLFAPPPYGRRRVLPSLHRSF